MEAIIRSAECSERASFARLILLSAPYFRELFGPGAEEIFQSLFCRKGNLFSRELVRSLYFEDALAGMILSYDRETGKRYSLNTGICFFLYATRNMLLKIPVFLRLNRIIGKLEPGDYYISKLAVFPEFRSRGGGRLLLKAAEEEARKKGLRCLVLDVERENEKAIRLYWHFGFEESRFFDIAFDRNTSLHFMRMIKFLERKEKVLREARKYSGQTA